MNVLSRLSQVEREQLGTPRLRGNGKPGKFRFPTEKEWVDVRRRLVANAMRSNAKVDLRLTAYTPGETLGLLDLDVMRRWFDFIRAFEVAEGMAIVLVPCAKSKPWDPVSSRRSKSYRAYHKIRAGIRLGKVPPASFVTVSEPLALVPESMWSAFPQYDNPGLFVDDYLRSSGMLEADWKRAGFGEKLIIPFDQDAYLQVVEILSDVIATFLKNHRGRTILSFVDDTSVLTTHSDMLTRAVLKSEVDVKRYPKKPGPRRSPFGPIVQRLKEWSDVRTTRGEAPNV